MVVQGEMDDEKNMKDYYHNSEIYMVIVTMMAVVIGTFWLLCKGKAATKHFKEQATQCQSALKDRSTNKVDKSTGYSLGDACRNAGTRDKLAREYYKFFHDMTVEGARGYLRVRGYTGGRLKIEVTQTCVNVRMREVMSGEVAEKFEGL